MISLLRSILTSSWTATLCTVAEHCSKERSASLFILATACERNEWMRDRDRIATVADSSRSSFISEQSAQVAIYFATGVADDPVESVVKRAFYRTQVFACYGQARNIKLDFGIFEGQKVEQRRNQGRLATGPTSPDSTNCSAAPLHDPLPTAA